MRRIVIVLVAVVTLAGTVAHIGPAFGQADGETAPIFGVKIPLGYRDWRLISVAHEEGNLNGLRAILGNDVAIKASRGGKPPFPDGTFIGRLAWSYVPLEESEKAFGRLKSFVVGPPKNGVQFMIKDSRKYASTGSWGFAQFNDGKPAVTGWCACQGHFPTELLPESRSCRGAMVYTVPYPAARSRRDERYSAHTPAPQAAAAAVSIRRTSGGASAAPDRSDPA